MAVNLRPEFPSGTPGNVCYWCGSAKRQGDVGIIDANIMIEFEGPLCVCQSCIVEAASHFGLMTKKQVDSVKEQNSRLAHRVSDLEMRCNVAEELIASFHRYEMLAKV